MDSLGVSVPVFLASGLVVVIAGVFLARYGDEIAEKTASQIEAYPSQDDRHLSEILAILDKEEPEFRT